MRAFVALLLATLTPALGAAPLEAEGYGTLVVTCTPECELFVDGVHRGKSPLRIELREGVHLLTAKRAKKVSVEVTIENQKTTMHRIKMD